MGWTSYHAHFYKKGLVDRKAEIDAMWDCDSSGKFTVLKSAMRGSTYYGAIKQKETKEVFAVVFLTSVNMKEYFNFSYKDMDESCGPYKCDCPKGILDLLTPTNNEYANIWRKRCYENIKAKKNPNALNNLPVGSVIKFKTIDGNEAVAYKHSPAYQFKRAFWMVKGTDAYIKTKHIPKDYVVIKRGE